MSAPNRPHPRRSVARSPQRNVQILLVVVAIGVFLLIASTRARSFGVVDEPLYAPGAIAMAAAVAGEGPASLDTTLSSHPPFGSLLLGLGLLGPPIFSAPSELPVSAAPPFGAPTPQCAISTGADRHPAIVATEAVGMRVAIVSLHGQVGTLAWGELPSPPQSCIDLGTHAALLLGDGSIVLVFPPELRSAAPRLSLPLVGPWRAIAPLGEGGARGLLARGGDGEWWRIDDPLDDAARRPTGFRGEQLVGLGGIAYLDGADASIDADEAARVTSLLSACRSVACAPFASRLGNGRAYLHGDVDAESRTAFRENLAAIAPVAYGHTRAAIGLDGDRVVLIDLDRTSEVLASVPVSATKLRIGLVHSGSDGFRLVLSTKGRIYSIVAGMFPAPYLGLNASRVYAQIDGVYPGGGDGLIAVATRDAAGVAELRLMETLRLQSIGGRDLEAPLEELGPGAVSLRGGTESVALARTAGVPVVVDTSGGSGRLRLSLLVAAAAMIATAMLLAGGAGHGAAGVAAIALLISPPFWDLALVGMLDGILAAILALALAAAIGAVGRRDVPRRALLLFLAGAATGLAGGVKLSAVIAGAPLLFVASIADDWSGFVAVARRVLAAVAALGVAVAAAAIVAGAGFGAVLNLAVCIGIVVAALRGPRGGGRRGRTAVLRDLATVTAGVLAGVAGAAWIPAAIGISVGALPIGAGDVVRIWLAEGAKIADGFLIDHPLGLPFWALALGLGVGFGGSVAPGLFAALWTCIAAVRRSVAPGDRLLGLALAGALSIVVWAPLSRILFPWYAGPVLVPIAAAAGRAIAARDARLVPMVLAVAAGPSIAWLSGPTLCLAAVSRLDRGCPTIGATDLVGTFVLVAVGIAASVGAAIVLRGVAVRRRAIPVALRHPLTLLAVAVAAVTAAEVAALAVSTALPALALRGFAVVVAMEATWGVALLAVYLSWRAVSLAAPLVFGASLLAVEAIRAVGFDLPIRAWFEGATQVGRVIPQPQLHPIPLALVGAAGALAVSVAAFGSRPWLVRYSSRLRGAWNRRAAVRGER